MRILTTLFLSCIIISISRAHTLGVTHYIPTQRWIDIYGRFPPTHAHTPEPLMLQEKDLHELKMEYSIVNQKRSELQERLNEQLAAAATSSQQSAEAFEERVEAEVKERTKTALRKAMQLGQDRVSKS